MLRAVSIEVTPIVSAASAYTAEDQVGDIQAISGAAQGKDEPTKLMSVTVTDKSKQSAALILYFFDELPTVASVDNGAFDITDAQMADKCIGTLAIAAGDYAALANSSQATVRNIQLPLFSKTASGIIYAVAKTTGTPTYGAVGDLVFKYAFEQY